jgi:hypothetical protein
MKVKRIFILLCATLLSNCSPGIGISNYKQLDNAAKEKFNNDYKISFNENKTYAICLKRFKTNPPMLSPPLTCFIYDIKNEKIIYQSDLASGNVTWKNDEQVEIERIPGTVTGFEPPDAFKDIYDVQFEKILDKK